MICTLLLFLQRTFDDSSPSKVADASASAISLNKSASSSDHQIITKHAWKLLTRTQPKTNQYSTFPRRLHYFVKQTSVPNSLDVQLQYFNVTLTEDMRIQVCFDDADVVDTYGTDIDNPLAPLYINATTAFSVIKRLDSDKKLLPGTVNAFSSWVQRHPEKPNPAETSECGLNIFLVWYPEEKHNHNGQWFGPEEIFGDAALLVEVLSHLEEWEQQSGFVCLNAAGEDQARYVEPAWVTEYAKRTVEFESPTDFNIYPIVTFDSPVDLCIYPLTEWRSRVSRFQPHYDINLSTLPVAGTYTFFRPI